MYFPIPFRLYENNIREGVISNVSFNPPTDNIEKATRIIRILNSLGEQGFDCITDPDDTEIIQSLDDGKSDNEIIKKYMKPCFDELDKLLLEQCKPIDEDRIISLILDGKSRKEIINVLMEECSFDVDMGEFNPNEAIDNLSNVSKWSLNKSTVGKLVWTIAGVLFALLGVYFSTFKTYQTLLKMYEENEKPSFKFKIADLFSGIVIIQGIFIVYFFIFCVFGDIADSFGDAIKKYLTHLVIFLIIVGSTFVISWIPSFVEIFENTFGYWLTKTSGISDNPFDNFRNRAFPTMEIDLTFLLTLFNVENFSETFDIFIESTLQKNGPVEEGNIFNDIEYIDPTGQGLGDDSEAKSKIKSQIHELTARKHANGHLMWRGVATLLAVLITFNAY